jgi:2-amino-4-hydroxy-6-hydroxymethyldihydropteridine diphosphokinase
VPTAFISIGSNIDRDKYILAGVKALKTHFSAIILSSVYESDAVGFDGNSFLNLIAAVETNQSPQQVDSLMHEIEKQNGRTSEQKKFNPRTLDLDLVLYDDFVSQDTELEIPRDEITRYAFVLEPLAEIVGSLEHPVLHKTYSALWQAFNKTGLVQKRINFDWG